MNSVNKTLYIPLYGKAQVSRKGIILRDPYAERIWDAQGFSLKGKAKSKWLAYNMGMRAAVFDRWTEEKQSADPSAVVLHIGCGLDSRALRVKSGKNIWFDVDFPEVMEERSRHFRESEGYHMISGDVRQEQWLDAVPPVETAIVVMEGVSMYLQPEELHRLLQRLDNRFAKVHLLMDTYTIFAAKVSRYKNPINSVGVTRVYGMDEPQAIAENTGFRVAGELDLTPEDLIGQLPKGEQAFFRRMFTGGLAKKIYRLYAYEN